MNALTALELTETGLLGQKHTSLTNKIIKTLGFSELGASNQTNTDALGNKLDESSEPSFTLENI